MSLSKLKCSSVDCGTELNGDECRTLSACFHKFHTRCLGKVPETKQDGKDGYKCPTCQTFTLKQDMQQPNYLVLKLSEREHEIRNNTFDKSCHLCKTSPAVVKCTTCKSIMCNNCKEKSHDQYQPMSSHEFAPIKDPLKIDEYFACQAHNRPLEVFCTIHEVLLCPHCCQNETHKNCAHIWICEANKRFEPQNESNRQALLKQAKTAKQKKDEHHNLLSPIDAKVNALVKLVNEQNQKAKSKIDADARKLIDALEEIRNDRKQKVENKKIILEHEIRRNESVAEIMKMVTESTENASRLRSFMSGIYYTGEEMAKNPKQLPEVNEIEEIKLQFFPSDFPSQTENALGEVKEPKEKQEPGQPNSEETKPPEAKKPADTKPPEAQNPAGTKPPETTKPVETKPPKAKIPAETKPIEDKKSVETKSPEAKKPAETKPPEDKKSVETKPPEAKKPAKTKPPEDKKSVETKPPEAKKHAETKPPEDKKPAETKAPEAMKPTETKPPDAKKPAETKLSEAKKPETKPPDAKKATKKHAEKHLPEANKPADTKSPDATKSAEIKPAGAK